MGRSDPGLRLLGRRNECEALDRLVASLWAGHSTVLVLRGEAGIGKSVLLDYVQQRSSGCRVARAAGVEWEMELAFAGLHQLCAPLLPHLESLPSPQRDALATAFGLSTGDPPDRFLVGLAVLNLLAEVAEQEPLVCLVDDAQWLDRVSVQTLAFVARRLHAERVGLVFAVREPSEAQQFVGLPGLMLGGLRNDEARALLDSMTLGRLDDPVRDRIVAETRGNPLALLELPRGFTAWELAGGFVRPDARPVPSQIEQSFLRRVQSLPAETQRLLLTAAAEPVGDVSLLGRAIQRLGIRPEVARPAQAAGLIEIGTQVRFRHPLVRSAAYRAADSDARQEIHRVLAEVTDADTDPDRRAWHRAHAAVDPDEAIADELERSADRAESRGGIAAAAAFLERATELTPDPARRAIRGLAAAQAKFAAASPDAAFDLLAAAELGPLDDFDRARLARLRAEIVFARNRGNDAAPLLLDAAKRLEGFDGALARETYLEALAAAIFAGRLGGQERARAVAEAVRAAPPGPQPLPPIDLLLDGVATLLTDGYAAGVPALRLALGSLREQPLRNRSEITTWLSLAPIAQEAFIHHLWDFQAWDDIATRAVRLARESGALAILPVELVYLAGVQLHAGDLAGASALIEEADAITAATGYAPVNYASLVLVGWRGEEAQAMSLIDASVKDATTRGEGTVLGLAGYVTAVLYNGLGRYDAALVGAQQASAHDDFLFAGWSLAELIEAGARSGARDFAAVALARLQERTRASGTDWALGIQARSAALLSDAGAAEALYREAIERLERSRVAIHLARAHLVYGEWLRRKHRRHDAREQLRTAYELFSRFGADAFAERARRELVATGETVRRRTAGTLDPLTARESQIARLASDGLTNPEIGAQLFISPHTVEWHLRKVFNKLGITSRKQLRSMMPGHAGTPTSRASHATWVGPSMTLGL